MEFLTVPTLVVGGFLLLAAATYLVDDIWAGGEKVLFEPVTGGLFRDPQSARDLLGVIATSIITVTSITFSLLLIAVQQGAAALTNQVFDQFLRRRANQLYFGFFIGVALYALAMLASIGPSHQPVLGVILAFVMTVVALCALIWLIYATIDQMRPVAIVDAIHNLVLAARGRQTETLQGTRRSPRRGGAFVARIAADRHGFLVRVDAAAIAKAVKKTRADVEVVFQISIGDFVAFRDPIAEVRVHGAGEPPSLERPILDALGIEEQRDIDEDPAFGIDQLATISWTSISTAKSNPQPGLLACQSLRDILARWSADDDRIDDGGALSPVVLPDKVPERLMGAFESLAVVASESMQHQVLAEILKTMAMMFPRLTAPLQDES